MAIKTTQPEDTVSESYISIGLGLLVVVVVGILLYNYFTQRGKQPGQEIKEETITEEATTSAQAGKAYKVQKGDTLWSISDKTYGTGFNWKKIQEANKLKEGAELEPGQKLFLPEVSPEALTQVNSPEPSASQPTASPEVEPAKQTPTTTITGNTYTVVKGDTLWDVACRAYGDCYAWTKIAQANKLVNPNLIHPGNVFTLPR